MRMRKNVLAQPHNPALFVTVPKPSFLNRRITGAAVWSIILIQIHNFVTKMQTVEYESLAGKRELFI